MRWIPYEDCNLTARSKEADQLWLKQREMDRLDLNHAVFVKALDQKLFLAPLEKAKMRRALDLGTGTGICMSCGEPGVDGRLVWKLI